MSTFTGPEPVSNNPLWRIVEDLQRERRQSGPWPPGRMGPDPRATWQVIRDPLPLLLEAYRRYGPVFTMRLLHEPIIWAVGPEATHQLLVAKADDLHWRHGHFGDLIPLLGDGLLTVDEQFHRQSRRAMLPAFHRERIAASTVLIEEEAAAAVAALVPGETIDIYAWTRRLALRIALRALFGIAPDRDGQREHELAEAFEASLAFYSTDSVLQLLRGPGTPWARMQRARRTLDRIIYTEIDARRGRTDHGDDLLGLLLDSRDEEGLGLTNRLVRDEVMTLLFAGHDTTTATVSFLFHELSLHPEVLDDEQIERQWMIDEALRLYPPAWVGPRRAVRETELDGHRIPSGAAVHYSSWVTHRLPDVWEEADAFRPHRFAPEAAKRIPRGAYIPFGGGQRKCIGMRFGLAEVDVISRLLLERFRPEPVPGFALRINQAPTLTPRDGLPLRLVAR